MYIPSKEFEKYTKTICEKCGKVFYTWFTYKKCETCRKNEENNE